MGTAAMARGIGPAPLRPPSLGGILTRRAPLSLPGTSGLWGAPAHADRPEPVTAHFEDTAL